MRPDNAVREFLEKENIRNLPVTCALSGGADSVCLLYCLLMFRQKYHLTISAIHIQHHLRGEESLRDEAFCVRLCENLHVPLKIVSVDVQAFRTEKAEKEHIGYSVENAARECRYQAFEQYSGGLTATAHNASDNLETVLFRLVRGTGLKGLCGIPERRDCYIRPLLKSSRREIESFLSEQNLSYVTDSTNQKDIYTRNFIRHHITPLLSGIVSGGAEKNISVMSEILSQEEDFLEISAQKAYTEHLLPEGCLRDLHILHPALQRRCIRLFLEKHHLPSGYRTVLSVQKLLASGGKTEIIRQKITAHVSQHILYLECRQPESPEKILISGENQIFSGYLVNAEIISRKNSAEFEKIHQNFAISALDYDIIKKPAFLHGRKNGLYLKPSDKTHTVSVKKWLQTQPVSQRNVLHYLSDENGLLWVQNLGTARRAAVTAQTQNMLVLHVHRTDTECTSDYHISDVY